MYNVRIWYRGLTPIEYLKCDDFSLQSSDNIVVVTVGKTDHIIPLFNVNDVEVTEIVDI